MIQNQKWADIVEQILIVITLFCYINLCSFEDIWVPLLQEDFFCIALPASFLAIVIKPGTFLLCLIAVKNLIIPNVWFARLHSQIIQTCAEYAIVIQG